MSKLKCPDCQTEILSDDRFCESCGKPLLSPTIDIDQTAVSITNVITGCQKCSASIDSIDVDGYCQQCGFRNQKPRIPQENDHLTYVNI